MTNRYSSLANYLKNLHPDIYDLCEQLDILRHISSGSRRVTFLMPDKKTLTAIKKLANSSPEEASILFSSHFIDQLLCTPTDFSNFKDNLYSINRYGITVKEISKDNIDLNGAIITIGKDPCGAYFRSATSSATSGFAIWDTEGQVEVDKTKIKSSMRRTNRGEKPEKTGSGEAEVQRLSDMRKLILETHFHEVLVDKFEALDHLHNIFRNVITKAMLDNTPESQLLLRMIKSLSGIHSIISFYVILFSEKLLESLNLIPYFITCLEYKSHDKSYNDLLNYYDNTGSILMSNIDNMRKLLEERDTIRLQLKENSNSPSFPTMVKSTYDNLEQNNQLGSCTNVYPSEYAIFISRNKHIVHVIGEIKSLIWDSITLGPQSYVSRMKDLIIPHFMPSLQYDGKIISTLTLKLDFGTARDFIVAMVDSMMLDFAFPRELIKERSDYIKDMVYGANDEDDIVDNETDMMNNDMIYGMGIDIESCVESLKAKLLRGETINMEDLNKIPM